MRKERIALKHHRDAALGGRHVIDDAPADRQVAVRHIFEPCDHAQQRGLAAARRPEEHAKLVLADLQIDVADHGRVVSIRFLHAPQGNARHRFDSVI
jgi:hypothetical protein